ncbi:peptidoglycan hydrolase-like protein with peptidoglycan-binding domain [Oerskovia enterophila]
MRGPRSRRAVSVSTDDLFGGGSAPTVELDPEGTGQAPGTEAAPPKEPGTGLRGHRLIWLVAGVAVLSLLAGILVSRLIVSPAQAAADAEAPAAGLITVPVETKVIANDVTLRGDVKYDDAVQVKVETADLGGPAVVTGQVPTVGAELGQVSVALEVSGRPVVVLPGDLPAYRTLRVGVSGPDVSQLKASLAAVGIDPGKVDSNVYDASTAAAVDKLYAAVGYPSPASDEEARAGVESATQGVKDAEANLDATQGALAAAKGGATDVEKLQADNAVRAAERALATAEAEGGDVAGAQDELRLARAQRAEVDKPKDVAEQSAAVTTAKRQLEDAKKALSEARSATLTALPASEVLFLASLPRRVDEVLVERGATISGPVMAVSGAALVIEASAAASDAELLQPGAKATFVLPDDSEATATVVSVEARKAEAEGKGGSGGDSGSGTAKGARFTVALTPDALTPEQVTLLQGSNVRLTIPVSSTAGEVLAVPLAALTAGPGGESRVEVVRGDAKASTAKDRDTELVAVQTGLAAGGFVEIVSSDGSLEVGDKVVVGK